MKKLQTVSDKLEKDKDKLKILLIEAGEETIKENIPHKFRVKCLEAWYMANDTCLLIKHAISQKNRLDIVDYYSAGKKSITRTKATLKLLELWIPLRLPR